MDLKGFISFGPRRNRVEDPSLSSPDEAGLSLAEAGPIDRTAENLTQASALALDGAGVSRTETGHSNGHSGRGRTEQRGVMESTPPEDLVKHILGDDHLRGLMRQRRKQPQPVRRARAAS